MFGKGIKLFTLFGFEVRLDASWIIIALLVTWTLAVGYFPAQWKNLPSGAYWLMGAVGALGLFFSIVVHEFTHSLVARRQGMPMRGITLFIFGGVAEMSDEPPNARSEFFMAVVGPLSSLALAGVFYGFYRWGLSGGGAPWVSVLGYLALINGVLAAFNLVPAFPLDGGRVLRSILWGVNKNLHWATKVSSSIGSGFAILLILLGVVSLFTGNFIGGLWWILIGMFLNSAARSSMQQLLTREALQGQPVSRFMQSDPVTVPPDITLQELVEDYFYKYHFKFFPVLNDGELAGCISTQQVKTVPSGDWNRVRVRDASASCSRDNQVAPQTEAIQALSLMSRSGTSRLMVVDQGKLVGIVTLKDLMRFLAMKLELET